MSRVPRKEKIYARCYRYMRCGNKRRLNYYIEHEPWIKTHGTDENSILWSAYYSRRPMFHWLLSRGFDPNIRGVKGGTILMNASGDNDIDAVTALVRAGANVDLQNDNSESALGYAIVWNHPDTVRLLIKSGADPSKPYHGWPNHLEFANFDSRDCTATVIREFLDMKSLS